MDVTIAVAAAGLITLGLLLTLADFLSGYGRVRNLDAFAPASDGPSVSVVVAARNEERGIEEALRSLLALDYPDLEIVVVNDRSTDGTGAILDRLHGQHPALHRVDVTDLPPGWLGKNHALAVGAAAARGDLLLFTDADVVFAPSTVRRAVTLMEAERLDHLTAVPAVTVPGVLLNAFVATFGVLFSVYSRPWKASDPTSRHHIGVGAFNLVRASAYQRMGTHAAIALRPDDDMRLGQLVKRTGHRQDVVVARHFLSVEWYRSVGEMIDGLMKNAFAGVHYSVPFLLGSTLALLAFNVWPWMALAVTRGRVQALYAAAATLLSLIFLIQARTTGQRAWFLLLYPFGVLLFVYVMWRSALLALTRRAIIWRGTAYPLRDLRAARPAPPVARHAPPG